MPQQPDLTSISYAYPGVGAGARAEVARSLAAAPPVPPGTLVLATCLRTEFLVHGDRARLAEVLEHLLGEVPEADGATIRSGGDAAVHLFRVAAGLESPVRGEVEILTQVRRAVRQAGDHPDTDGTFSKLLEASVASGRLARESFPSSPHDSLAAVAAQVVGDREAVAVFGGGAMAAAVVEALSQLPAPPRIAVVARNPGALVRAGVESWPFHRAAEALARFPAVISATSAKRRLVPDDVLAAALAARVAPLVLVDMAMPPDFARPATDGGTRYLDIDDLAGMAGRRAADDGADELVLRRAEDAYARFSRHHRVGPVIARMVADADDVVAEAVARFAGRLRHREDEALLRQAAHTVARTLIARPLAYLNGAGPARDVDDVDAVAEAFDATDG
jgi:glutamyl-tRNA reductase